MKVFTPTTLPEALARLRDDPALMPIAGGTDLMVHWHARPHDDLRLLDLSRLNELKYVRLGTDTLELGALATYWDVLREDVLSGEFSLLAAAAHEVGAIQIQTRGTWAGNIGNGSPAADGVPALMACDARVVLTRTDVEREVPPNAYWTGYKKSVKRADELITAIRLPRRPRLFEFWHKVGSRAAQAITKIGAAMLHDEAGWRVCVNSAAPFVKRCRALETALEANVEFHSPQALAEILAADISPIDDIRSTAEYRREVLSRILFFGLQPPARTAASRPA